MSEFLRKRAGAKAAIVLLSIFLFLFLFSTVAFAETYQYGDVNKDGNINVLDVVPIVKHALELELLEGESKRLADINGDRKIDVQDVTLAMQLSLGLIDDIVDTLIADGDFETLVAAVVEAELVDALKADGPFTVFAPTDEAFADLLDELGITADELLELDDLADILLYHVVEGDFRARDFVDDAPVEIETLQGEKIKITVDNGKVYVNDAEVIDADIIASNGVIHAIDGVLLPTADLLEVVSIEAINPSTIRVTFSEAIDGATVDNFSLDIGTVDTVTLTDGNTRVRLGVSGLDYGDEVEITITDITAGEFALTSYTETIIIPLFGEVYKLEITVADDVILADGLSKTMVSAQIIERATDEAVTLDGLVSFTTTKGTFAQPEVSFDNQGIAALQLTSEVSTETIIAYITATVTSVPAATEYEGLVGQGQVRFAPEGELEDELLFVTLVSASASQADRINLTFSGPITVTDIIDSYPGATATARYAAARADNFGFQVNYFGKGTGDQVITNIEQIGEKRIRLILDVDGYFDYDPLVETTELRFDYIARTGSAHNPSDGSPVLAGDLNGAFLRDNMTHNVSVPVNIGNKVVANAEPFGVDFILTDTSRPWIAGVEVESQMFLDVRFSEAMAADLVEAATLIDIDISGTDDIKRYTNIRVDGRFMIEVLPGADATLTQIRTYATDNNLIIVNDISVNHYWGVLPAPGVEGVVLDDRNIATIHINAWNKLAAGEYSLQVSNVGDWAGMTHDANLIETQTFDFTVEEDTTVPTAKVIMQSPEQWLIEFNMPVKLANGMELQDAIKISAKDNQSFTMTDALAPADHYQVTAISEDGLLAIGPANGIAPTSTATVVNNVERLLIEFKKDWTQIYDTANTGINYFHSTKNPYKVELEHWVAQLTENVMSKHTLSVSTPLDAQSPEIIDAVDIGAVPGNMIQVEMSEPVQMVNGVDTVPLTPSQQQDAGPGIPTPTFEFVKGDDVIPATLLVVAQDDYTFTVTPDNTLEPGIWQLIIRSISDDVGNTSATVTYDFEVPEPADPDVTAARISWIAFDNAATDHDYIYIKFTKEMKSTGPNGVSRTTNYTLNNEPLPTGSEIIKGIKDIEGNAVLVTGDVTNEWDGVTIKMPADAWDGTPGPDYTMVVGVASNFETADGEALIGPYTVQADNLPGGSLADADFRFEALYVNPLAANTIDGKPVTAAAGYDGNADGKINVILFLTNNGDLAVGAPGDQVLVNGVQFTTDGLFVYESAVGGGVTGTATTGLIITAVDGSIIINSGNVIDLAGPQVINAKAENLVAGALGNGSTITLTFSEAIDRDAAAVDPDAITAGELEVLFGVSSDEDYANNARPDGSAGNGYFDTSGGVNDSTVTGSLNAAGTQLTITIAVKGSTTVSIDDYIIALSSPNFVDAFGNQVWDITSSNDLTGHNNVQIK